MIDFDFPTEELTFIKVIGVGGGGGNAVNHMYSKGIKNVSFVVCNTDYQDLQRSPVPIKIQIGPEITHGLGCGANPDKGREAAEESENEIKNILDEQTRMVFVTAGMGGGTGTGAAPVIAKIAHDMGKLTVGIVTIPFKFEMSSKIEKALNGVMEMRKNVDALLIINNQRLCDLYQNLPMSEAFKKADNILSDSALAIAEIITKDGYINVDFADVCTILKDSGVAIMNTGYAGKFESDDEYDDNYEVQPHRITAAIEDALNSPLLNNSNIKGAKKILINICTTREYEIAMSEVDDIQDFINSINKNPDEVIWGARYNDELKKGEIQVTIIATGFGDETIKGISGNGPITAETIEDMYAPQEKPDYMTGIHESQIQSEEEDDTIDFDGVFQINNLDAPAYLRNKK